MKTGVGPVKLEVMNPSNELAITAKNARRLDTLNGKTICEVLHSTGEGASGGWRGGDTFPVIRELLQKRFPGARIVPYSQFPPGSRSVSYPYWVPTDQIGEVLKAKGCDAVLVGNGG